ncbi:hypothetical protein H4J38_16300 [Colwellia sp. BRX10-3]|uniref:hypothetical protein n=1 Tax=Colwellia sp. BRX10-3 TaxID=2759844 RepID=UPI0015F5AA71|nr:hypothetical protein [Colwellia sp. BRX10-3]MBA6392329.1 hypothetical protein [Colwellia sp. BRX10-3]
MKVITKLLLLPFTLVVSSQTLANDNFTFGIGAGSLYSGVGVNIGFQSKTDLKYISAGCVSYSSLYGETCGVGAGWVRTDVFDFQTPKHGISLYVGIVGDEYDDFDRKAVYGAGLGYHYFFNGINNSGVNLGFTIVAGNENDEFVTGGMFQVGYQF